MSHGRLWAACFFFLLAALQAFFLLPQLSGEVAHSLGPLRVDAPALLFGASLCASICLALPVAAAGARTYAHALLMALGLLVVCYAREGWALAVGWELSAVGAALSLSHSLYTGRGGAKWRWRSVAIIHAPGLVAAPALVGLLGPFEPAGGGALREWPTLAVAAVGAVIALRFFLPGLLLRLRAEAPELPESAWPPALHIYAACGPVVLARLLVGGRWDVWGVWLLALLGVASLLLAAWDAWLGASSAALLPASASMCGFALASASPLAAVGAVALLIVALVAAAQSALLASSGLARSALFAASLGGLWLVSQGALDAGYAVVAALLLPSAFVAGTAWRDARSGRAMWPVAPLVTLFTLLAAAAAVLPQGVVWLAERAVSAMPGGVAAVSGLRLNWSLGLEVASPAERALAALPATGLALAIFLAWASLHLSRQLALRFGAKTERDDA